MICPNCAFDIKEWNEITDECSLTMKKTSSTEYAYITLVHKKTVIGSFNFDYGFMYYDRDSKSKDIELIYKVQLIPREGDLAGYFKVYRKKK